MNYPQIRVNIQHRSSQDMQMQGINLSDNYADGQLESSKNISANRFPYITTADQLQEVDTGIPAGFYPVSMFAWEKLFVVSNVRTMPYDELETSKTYHGGDTVVYMNRCMVFMHSGTISYSELPTLVQMFQDGWVEDTRPQTLGFKCYYGGEYCGDVKSLDLPKQYAVVNSKLVVWPDKVMFDLKEESITAQEMNTAPTLATVNTGTIEYRKAVE